MGSGVTRGLEWEVAAENKQSVVHDMGGSHNAGDLGEGERWVQRSKGEKRERKKVARRVDKMQGRCIQLMHKRGQKRKGITHEELKNETIACCSEEENKKLNGGRERERDKNVDNNVFI